MSFFEFKKHLTNWQQYGYFVIAIISFGFHLRTLITSYFYYLLLLFCSIAVVMIFDIYKKRISTNWDRLVICSKTFLVLYFAFFSILFFVKQYKRTEVYRIPIEGYYTSRIDGIIFIFQNFTFNRNADFANLYSENITRDYDILIELRQPIVKIYFVESISFIRKTQTQIPDQPR
jgi:hypothetical protein